MPSRNVQPSHQSRTAIDTSGGLVDHRGRASGRDATVYLTAKRVPTEIAIGATSGRRTVQRERRPALADGLEQHHRGRGGHVEARHLTAHRNRRQPVAALPDEAPQACCPRPRERRRSATSGRSSSYGSAASPARPTVHTPACFQVLDRPRDVHDLGDPDVGDRARPRPSPRRRRGGRRGATAAPRRPRRPRRRFGGSRRRCAGPRRRRARRAAARPRPPPPVLRPTTTGPRSGPRPRPGVRRLSAIRSSSGAGHVLDAHASRTRQVAHLAQAVARGRRRHPDAPTRVPRAGPREPDSYRRSIMVSGSRLPATRLTPEFTSVGCRAGLPWPEPVEGRPAVKRG